MKVAFGFKTHSGWAAMIVLGKDGSNFVVVDRQRMQLVDEEWVKQPYHAAEELESLEARKLVARGIAHTHHVATRELKAAVKREARRGNEVQGVGVVVGNDMPPWSVGEILAVHFRMHKAEGVLFRETLAYASEKCDLKFVAVSDTELTTRAQKSSRLSSTKLNQLLASLGKSIGAPWGKDQKEATLAATVVLNSA
jgi:hypothetical protein